MYRLLVCVVSLSTEWQQKHHEYKRSIAKVSVPPLLSLLQSPRLPQRQPSSPRGLCVVPPASYHSTYATPVTTKINIPQKPTFAFAFSLSLIPFFSHLHMYTCMPLTIPHRSEAPSPPCPALSFHPQNAKT